MFTNLNFPNKRQNNWLKQGVVLLGVALFMTVGVSYASAEEVVVEGKEPPAKQKGKISATIDNGTVTIVENDKTSPLPLPQSALAIHQTGDTLYVALGSSGVQVFRLNTGGAKLIRTILATEGDAVGFFVAGNRLWLETKSTSASVLQGAVDGGSGVTTNTVQEAAGASEGNPATENTPVTMTPSTPTAEEHLLLTREEPISVVDVFPGEVKLNVGTDDGVQLKDHFEIYREISVKGGGELFVGTEMVAMVEITAVNRKSAMGKLPRGDRALKGDTAAYVKKRINQRNVVPRKLERIGNVGFTARPILNLAGNSGGGALIDMNVSWYGKHTFTAFRVEPLALGGTNEGGIFSSMMLAEGGYDGRAFAVGLGVGSGITNGRMNATIGDGWVDDAGTDANSGVKKNAAFALSQFIRLGPLDGLNLTIHNAFLFASIAQVGSENEGFTYGSTSAKVNIPLGYRLNLFLGGGGSRLGHAYGEAGVHVWLRGNGDGGSIGVSGAVGGAGAWVEGADLDQAGYAESRFMAGPMVSFGLNYRFGS